VKTANRWLLPGATIAGLICSHAPLRAQPAGAPDPADDRTTQVGGAPAQAGDTPTPAGGAPIPTGGAPIVTGDMPTPTGGAPIATGEPDQPWNRGVSAESRWTARERFLEGNRLFRIPLFAKAAEQYAVALGQWKHPAFYFNLALAQLNLGKEVEAHESLQHALAYGEAPLGAEQFREAQKQLQEVERQLGQIRVTCQTPGAEVTLDGVTLFIGPGSYRGWVKAKAHELTAKQAGYLSEARRVTVSSGQLQDIELKLITLSEATDISRRWAAWKPWAVIAAGGAIAATGGALHALSARNFNDYDEEFLGLSCVTDPDPASPGCTKDEVPSDLNDQLILARREQAIAVGGYIVGGSLIAAGVVLLYMNQPRMAEQRVGSPSARSVAVVPTVSRDLLGILVNVSH
jgi:tetratricopeptide (TPR) repeat protein